MNDYYLKFDSSIFKKKTFEDIESSIQNIFKDYLLLYRNIGEMSSFNDLYGEYYSIQCLTFDEAKKILNKLVDELSNVILVTSSVSKILLYKNKWDIHEVIFQYIEDANKLFVKSKTLQANFTEVKKDHFDCPVCLEPVTEKLGITNLACGHCYCDNCWRYYFEMKIKNNVSTEISCMTLKCDLLVPEDIVLSIVNKQILKKQYQDLAIRKYIESHPLLRFCPGANCNAVIQFKECLAKKAKCIWCKLSFCIKCGNDHHAPANCETFKKWLTKLSDKTNLPHDVKRCPKCCILIQKDGGCDYMTCWKCKFEFCWVCLKFIRTHSINKCFKRKENPYYDPFTPKAQKPAKSYIFYLERYETHSINLKSEKQTLDGIKKRINSELVTNEKTWDLWQYLLRAADLIFKCEYTLKFTYLHAYYMKDGPVKEIFEYQQAQLEEEIEKLWVSIENAYSEQVTSKHMRFAEKLNILLLKKFA